METIGSVYVVQVGPLPCDVKDSKQPKASVSQQLDNTTSSHRDFMVLVRSGRIHQLSTSR